MSSAPPTIHIAEDIGGITATVPRRASALARHVLDRVAQIMLACVVIVFMVGRLVSPFLALTLIVILGAIGLAARTYRDHLAGGMHQQLRITPQRLVFPTGEIILEDVEAIRLDLDRGRLLISAGAPGPVGVLGELDYAELAWLRDFLQRHIDQRRAIVGEALSQPAAPPDELLALRER